MDQSFAVIDIGSNAIRASAYGNNKAGTREIYTEKFKSDVKQLLEKDNIDDKHHCYLILEHFQHIFNNLGIQNIICIATASLRNSAKAQEFIEIVKRKFEFDITIISGETEARLGALGVISGIRNAAGIVADFGGGSLEIAHVETKEISHLYSFPFGTKILNSTKDPNYQEIERIISEECAVRDVDHIYFIGGALRLLGRLYLDYANHPLKNLHNLRIKTKEFLYYLEKIEKNPNRYNSTNNIYNHRNVENLQFAANITRVLVGVFNPKYIVISNYGVKEGKKFELLDQSEKNQDIIFEKLKNLTNFDQQKCDLTAYCNIFRNIYPNHDQNLLELLEYAIILTDLIKNIDKTFIANFISEFILSCDVPFSHKQRVSLGVIMSFMYRSKADLRIHFIAKKILGRIEYDEAKMVGHYLRIARNIDGPKFVAPSFHIEEQDKILAIRCNRVLPKDSFRKICRHLKTIGLTKKGLSRLPSMMRIES